MRSTTSTTMTPPHTAGDTTSASPTAVPSPRRRRSATLPATPPPSTSTTTVPPIIPTPSPVPTLKKPWITSTAATPAPGPTLPLLTAGLSRASIGHCTVGPNLSTDPGMAVTLVMGDRNLRTDPGMAITLVMGGPSQNSDTEVTHPSLDMGGGRSMVEDLSMRDPVKSTDQGTVVMDGGLNLKGCTIKATENMRAIVAMDMARMKKSHGMSSSTTAGSTMNKAMNHIFVWSASAISVCM